jgi:spore coat protein CotH
VDSKDNYLSGTFRIVEDIKTRGAGDVFEDSVKIKGRGNSTWLMPKRPYKLKFDKKVSLLGEPADKEWVLLANYVDKTFLRNRTAFDMGHMSKLEYTNRSHFVELVLNGEYCGTYQLAEQIKVGADRVNVGDDGYLLEVDAKADSTDVTFIVKRVGQPINIKSPEVEVGDSAYNYVVDYLNTVERVLFSDDFKDPSKGYAKYIDVASFVDWYLINEIAKNNDACFFSSCYMTLARNGKLKMGPLWDYDIAFGNVNYNTNDDPEGFYICTNVSWYRRLFADAAFVKLVQERFEYFYSNKEVIFNEINRNAEYLQYAAVENNNKWGVLYEYTWPNNEILG